MKPEEINVAIAEVCGWEFVPSHDQQGKAVPERWIKDGFEYFDDRPFPNYYKDLNAIHEAEKYFDDKPIDLKSLYYDYIGLEVGWTTKTPNEARWQVAWNSMRATSQQKSRAFVKAIGKWVETKGEGE